MEQSESMSAFVVIEKAYGWCRDFVNSMPAIKKDTDMYSLIVEYQRTFPTYILEKYGANELSYQLISSLLEGVRKWIKERIKYDYGTLVDGRFVSVEESSQFILKNAQREWKRYGSNHFFSKTGTAYALFLEGAKMTFANTDGYAGGLKEHQVFLGLKIIEYTLLLKMHPFVMEWEERKRQLREEEKALRELQREKERAEKDVEKANAAIKKNEAALDKAKTSAQVKKLKQQIEELKVALQRAEERRDRAISMAQQTRCGYVYVISNIGSFGEGIYKIGMTRRIDPMQRVRELGDASVPYPFDVHAMIYTEDAPALESHLHRVFDLYKLNTMNWRKEYFRVPLSSIREEVEKCGVVCEWVDTPSAEQYRESEWIRSIGNLGSTELEDFIEKYPEEFEQRERSFEYNPFEVLEEDME